MEKVKPLNQFKKERIEQGGGFIFDLLEVLMERMQQEYNNVQAELSNYRESASETIESLNHLLKLKSSEIETLSNKLSDAEKEITLLQKENQGLSIENSSLVSKIDGLSKTKTDVEAEYLERIERGKFYG